jgi:DNA-binding CsgD family transcriptional regulator
MVAELVLFPEGKARVPICSLWDGRFILGRSSECDIVILDATVSRQHAEILVERGAVSIRDLGSRNGTYVDDEAAREKTPVRCGQRICLGSVLLMLDIRPAETVCESELETEPCQSGNGVVSSGAKLSPAQERVFRLLLKGLADKQIAKTLCISSKTVHQHVQAIFQSAGVHSRTELLAMVLGQEANRSGTVTLNVSRKPN